MSEAENLTERAVFDAEHWRGRLPELAKNYQNAEPFPSIHLTDLTDPEVLRAAASEFPAPDDPFWISYRHYNENKLGKTKRDEFPEAIGRVVDALNSDEFVGFLSELTGISGLMADPSLEGGGMHQTPTGGFLNVHADFTMHHHQENWRRRCNVILYVNEDWDEAWGGAIELWDREMKHCVKQVPPQFNHALIFNTDEHSFHGYADPISCPPEIGRKSIALYYYTVETDKSYRAKSTNYQARPGDGLKGVLVWLDKQAVNLYSKLKKRLNLSDDFVGKILGKFK